MEYPFLVHLSNMIRPHLLLLELALAFVACHQTNSNNEATVTNQDTSGAVQLEQLSFDTSKIAFLPIDTSNQWIFKDARPLTLTIHDLDIVEKQLSTCIAAHNSRQDTTKQFSEYIDLQKYKRQYIAFIDSNGEKKVYVNCFCDTGIPNEFYYWKNNLVEVEDGGSCFFQVTINLTKNRYEQFGTNGYA